MESEDNIALAAAQRMVEAALHQGGTLFGLTAEGILLRDSFWQCASEQDRIDHTNRMAITKKLEACDPGIPA